MARRPPFAFRISEDAINGTERGFVLMGLFSRIIFFLKKRQALEVSKAARGRKPNIAIMFFLVLRHRVAYNYCIELRHRRTINSRFSVSAYFIIFFYSCLSVIPFSDRKVT